MGGGFATLTYTAFIFKSWNDSIVWNPYSWTRRLLLPVCCRDKCCCEYPVHVAQSAYVTVSLVHSPRGATFGLQGNAHFPLYWIASGWSPEWLNNLFPLSLEKDLLLPPLPSPNLGIITNSQSNGSEVICPCEFHLPFSHQWDWAGFHEFTGHSGFFFYKLLASYTEMSMRTGTVCIIHGTC